jgi:hypothetical protein
MAVHKLRLQRNAHIRKAALGGGLRINHREAYSWDGACTNQAESYFSRLRRSIVGQHHHVSHRYLYQYANEMAWREDHRRQGNGGQHATVLASALHSPISRTWKGYWQRAA